MGERLVVDTNVLISALGWRGAPREIVRLCIAGRCTLLLSPEILSEVERVLHYPKFKFTPIQIDAYLEQLTEAAELIQPDRQVEVVVGDPSDNRFLECALAGQADVVISNDRHLLDLERFASIPILRPQIYLNRRTDR